MTRRVHHEPRRATTATVPNVHPAHLNGRRDWEHEVLIFAATATGIACVVLAVIAAITYSH